MRDIISLSYRSTDVLLDALSQVLLQGNSAVASRKITSMVSQRLNHGQLNDDSILQIDELFKFAEQNTLELDLDISKRVTDEYRVILDGIIGTYLTAVDETFSSFVNERTIPTLSSPNTQASRDSLRNELHALIDNARVDHVQCMNEQQPPEWLAVQGARTTYNKLQSTNLRIVSPFPPNVSTRFADEQQRVGDMLTEYIYKLTAVQTEVLQVQENEYELMRKVFKKTFLKEGAKAHVVNVIDAAIDAAIAQGLSIESVWVAAETAFEAVQAGVPPYEIMLRAWSESLNAQYAQALQDKERFSVGQRTKAKQRADETYRILSISGRASDYEKLKSKLDAVKFTSDELCDAELQRASDFTSIFFKNKKSQVNYQNGAIHSLFKVIHESIDLDAPTSRNHLKPPHITVEEKLCVRAAVEAYEAHLVPASFSKASKTALTMLKHSTLAYHKARRLYFEREYNNLSMWQKLWEQGAQRERIQKGMKTVQKGIDEIVNAALLALQTKWNRVEEQIAKASDDDALITQKEKLEGDYKELTRLIESSGYANLGEQFKTVDKLIEGIIRIGVKDSGTPNPDLALSFAQQEALQDALRRPLLSTRQEELKNMLDKVTNRILEIGGATKDQLSDFIQASTKNQYKFPLFINDEIIRWVRTDRSGSLRKAANALRFVTALQSSKAQSTSGVVERPSPVDGGAGVFPPSTPKDTAQSHLPTPSTKQPSTSHFTRTGRLTALQREPVQEETPLKYVEIARDIVKESELRSRKKGEFTDMYFDDQNFEAATIERLSELTVNFDKLNASNQQSVRSPSLLCVPGNRSNCASRQIEIAQDIYSIFKTVDPTVKRLDFDAPSDMVAELEKDMEQNMMSIYVALNNRAQPMTQDWKRTVFPVARLHIAQGLEHILGLQNIQTQWIDVLNKITEQLNELVSKGVDLSMVDKFLANLEQSEYKKVVKSFPLFEAALNKFTAAWHQYKRKGRPQ